jgi:hypothetical protein
MGKTFRIVLNLAFFIGLSSAAIGQTSQFGSWNTGRIGGNEGLFAATVNDSGHILGQYCYFQSDSCIYLLAFQTACKPESKYPVLVNSDVGSSQVFVYCSGQLSSGKYRYVFTDFEEIDKVIKGANKVGFAVPLEGDKFLVVRFTLNGSNEAIASMRTTMADGRRATPTPVRGTRDQRL